MTKTKIYYNIRNAGDGSAYVVFFDSEKLADLDAKYDWDPFAEYCTGHITIEHDGDIKISHPEIMTRQDVIKEIKEELEYNPDDTIRQNHLRMVQQL